MCFHLLAEVHSWHRAYLSESSMKELILIGKLFFSLRGVFTLLHACGLVVMLSDQKYQHLYHHQDQVFKNKNKK
jgi:hypothetical protein